MVEETTFEIGSDIWEYNGIKIDEQFDVIGAAYTYPTNGGYDVQIGVSSYELGDRYEANMNHVPNVTVVHPDGHIIGEPHVHDSHSAETAIENAVNCAEFAYNHIERHIQSYHQ